MPTPPAPPVAAPNARPPAAAPIPFGRYELLASLGRGGMAEIFLAREQRKADLLVLKRVLPEFGAEKEFLQMLVGEAKVASLLHHPSIVRLVDLGFEQDQVYLAMEYVPGWSLLSVAKAAFNRVPPGVAARVGRAVAEALAHAHDSLDLTGKPLRVVHRDVTPGNVMITPSGEVKLIDFGVAKAATQLTKTAPGVVKGKFRFLSPEQILQQPVDGRSDLFSLGVTLYEVTTGTQAFGFKSPAETFDAIVNKAPKPPHELVPGYPPQLEAVLLRALEKQAAARFPDAASMAAALADALRHIHEKTELAPYLAELSARAPNVLPPPFLPTAFGASEARSIATDVALPVEPPPLPTVVGLIAPVPETALPPPIPVDLPEPPSQPTKVVMPQVLGRADHPQTAPMNADDIQKIVVAAEQRAGAQAAPAPQPIPGPDPADQPEATFVTTTLQAPPEGSGHEPAWAGSPLVPPPKVRGPAHREVQRSGLGGLSPKWRALLALAALGVGTTVLTVALLKLALAK